MENNEPKDETPIDTSLDKNSSDSCPRKPSSELTKCNEDDTKIDRILVFDCGLYTPIPWLMFACAFIISGFVAAKLIPGDEDIAPFCDEWNLVEHNWKLENCSIYLEQNNDDGHGSDAWRLCNMFINVNKLHNPKYNWFDANISVCLCNFVVI